MNQTFRARDHRGRYNPQLQALLEAGMLRPWRFSDYRPINPREVEPGDRFDLRELSTFYDQVDLPHLYEIKALWWGDYIGDDISRSNHRSLARDYPNQFLHLTSVHDAHGLALLPTFSNQQLTSQLLRLDIHPLYDEQDHSLLVDELAYGMWDGVLELDVPAQLREQHGIDCDRLGISNDQLRDLFYTLQGEYGDEHAPDAVSVEFPSQDRVVADMAGMIRSSRLPGQAMASTASAAGGSWLRGAAFSRRPATHGSGGGNPGPRPLSPPEPSPGQHPMPGR